MQTHACQRVAAHPLTDSRRSLAAICGHHSNGNQNSSQTAPKHVRLFLTHTHPDQRVLNTKFSPLHRRNAPKARGSQFLFLSVALNALSIQFLARTSIDQYYCASSDSRGTIFQVAKKLISHMPFIKIQLCSIE